MCVLRLTPGVLDDLEEALDGYLEECFDSFRMWLAGRARPGVDPRCETFAVAGASSGRPGFGQ